MLVLSYSLLKLKRFKWELAMKSLVYNFLQVFEHRHKVNITDNELHTSIQNYITTNYQTTAIYHVYQAAT